MPPKAKVKESMETEKLPPLRLNVRIELPLTDLPLCPRTGHMSYVHPRTGTLYLIGGCDTGALAPPLKAWDAVPLPPSAPMPLLEQSDPATWCRPQACSSVPAAGGEENDGIGQLLEKPQRTDSLEITEKPQTVVEPSNVRRKSGEGTGKGGPSKKSTSKTKGKGNEKMPKKAEEEEKEVEAETEVEAPPVAPEAGDAHCDAKAPDDFTWSTLAAIAVRWKEEENTNNPASEAKSEETAEAEHPSVYFIGGWSGGARVSSVVGVDLSAGHLLPLRCGNLLGIPPVTCATATIIADCAYVFGGNAAIPGVAAMDVLDLRAGRWVDRQAGSLPGSPPPRSSHVAAPLLGRYVLLHGGRSLPPRSDTAPDKGKKAPKRVDAKAAVAQPILPVSTVLHGDTAVFDTVGGRWAQVTFNTTGPAPRYAHAACALSECEVLLHGGVDTNGAVLSDMWIVHAQERAGGVLTLSWLHVEPCGEDSEALPARCRHSIAAAERRVFITGGDQDAGRVEGVKDLFVVEIDPLTEAVVVPAETRRKTTTVKTTKQK